MKDIIKKQKRSIIVKITSIFVTVWLIVSVVFSIAVISMEKTEIFNQEQEKFRILVNSIKSSGSSYADLYVDNLKQPYTYIIDTEKPEITCGADGYLDNSMQAVVLSKNEDGTYSEIIDTDKSILIHGYTFINEDSVKSMAGGNIYYDSFVQSITQEQLQSISDYLYTKKDKDGNYYELICTKFYFDEENLTIIPKTVEIVLTNKDNTWYAQDEVIETYELKPKADNKLKLYTSSDDDRNVIPGQFVLGTFKSSDLIEAKADDESYTFLDMSYEKVAPFTCLYKNGADIQTEEMAYDDILYKDSESSGVVYYYKVYAQDNPTLVINYAKLINVLDSCKESIAIGISSFFLFFLIIGIILSIMMCKVIKTQYAEEQKRVEVSNALAHDIKTPLFIISGFVQNLKDNINTDKRDHYCDRIIERVGEANDIVHKMLDFSKLSSTDYDLKFDNFDVTAYTKELITSFEETDSGKNFILNVNAQCTPYADKVLMQRAISNLIDNAVRYCDDNTDIVIDINEKTFSISNVCKSISEEDIKHITEPYYRVEKNRESKGNGLGLSIIKSILDIHGYKLDIKFDNQIITFSIQF